MKKQYSSLSLSKAAKEILAKNLYEAGYTIPSAGLYPHQVLWDSCFIAIGKSTYDTNGAKRELKSLLRGQWDNGMIPHIIFNENPKYAFDARIWKSKLNDCSPPVPTSGLTQPPMFTIAINEVGKKLPKMERLAWYTEMFPAALAYHEWLYEERDPENEGLVVQIHPWETGLDTTPPWIKVMRNNLMPLWVRGLEVSKLYKVGEIFRTDTKFVPAKERSSTIEALNLFILQQRLRSKKYDIDKILSSKGFAIQDITFNSVFARANISLTQIAKELKTDIPKRLQKNIELTSKAIDKLCWDPDSGQYYSRNFHSGELIKEPSVGTFMPLFGGSVSKNHAQTLVKLLNDSNSFGSKYPVPSVPLNSKWYRPDRYWQGPTWVNTNWFVIKGLLGNGLSTQAKELCDSTLNMVSKSGFYEYFDPSTGKGFGIQAFSWTAALALDLLAEQSSHKP